MRTLRALLALAILATLLSSPLGAWACTCASTPSPVHDLLAEYERWDFSFVGVVTDRRPAEDGSGGIVYTVDVDAVHKGEVPDPVEATTNAGGGAACGVDLQVGRRYHIADEYRPDGSIHLDACRSSVTPIPPLP